MSNFQDKTQMSPLAIAAAVFITVAIITVVIIPTFAKLFMRMIRWLLSKPHGGKALVGLTVTLALVGMAFVTRAINTNCIADFKSQVEAEGHHFSANMLDKAARGYCIH
jgi:hypothetical protein